MEEYPERKRHILPWAHFIFDSVGAFVEAFQPHAAIFQGDIKNYTDVEPVYQISEVKIYKPSSVT